MTENPQVPRTTDEEASFPVQERVYELWWNVIFHTKTILEQRDFGQSFASRDGAERARQSIGSHADI